MKQLLLTTPAYKILDGDARSQKLSHAYMLAFPDAKNLGEALKFFALRIFGESGDTPKGKRILNGAYPDCKFYPKDGKKLTAEAVAEILDDCALKAVEGDEKLYIICGFDEAPPLLQNKLLKTLEEPLAGVRFLLGAVSLAPVLDTVLSRVRLLEIPPFTEQQIYSALERKGANELNRKAARSANGILGSAENMVSGGWFNEVSEAAEKICSAVRYEDAGGLASAYGDIKYKTELLSEMQRLYFAALRGEEKLPLEKPAIIFALEKIGSAFADLKYNAVFSGLLYDFVTEVVRENYKWRKLSA